MAKRKTTPPPPFADASVDVGFQELAERLALDPRGFCLLSGVEDGPAGLAWPERWGHADEGANSFSFCVNGATYTAFEDPEDGYRSSMGAMAMREGNWCAVRFGPVALIPKFDDGSYDPGNGDGCANIFSLEHPSTGAKALAIGTDHSDDWYPCFVSHHDPKTISSAADLGLALAYSLETDIPDPEKNTALPKLRL